MSALCRPKRTRLVTLAVLACAMATSALAQPRALPPLPELDGAFAVSTLHVELSAAGAGSSPLASDNAPARFTARVFYPAAATATPAHGLAYLPLLEAVAAASNTPEGWQAYRGFRSRSSARAPFAGGAERRPLIVFIPGRGQHHSSYTMLAEDLASRGYVVAAVDVPAINVVAHADGDVRFADNALRPPRELFAGPYAGVDAFFSAASSYGARLANVAADEIVRLARSDADSPLFGHIDARQRAYVGHSLGARVAAEACAGDRRCVAAIGVEGVAPPSIRANGFPRGIRYGIIIAASQPPGALDNYRAIIPNARAAFWLASIEGGGHNSITDDPYLSEQNPYAVEPLQGYRDFRDVALAMLDNWVLGRATGPPQRSGISIERHEPSDGNPPARR